MDEDSTVFDSPGREMPPALRRRSTLHVQRRKTVLETAAPLLDAGLSTLFRGEWQDAEVRLRVSGKSSAATCVSWATLPLHQFVLERRPELLEEATRRAHDAENACDLEMARFKTGDKERFSIRKYFFSRKLDHPVELTGEETSALLAWSALSAKKWLAMLVVCACDLLRGRSIMFLFHVRKLVAAMQAQKLGPMGKLVMGMVHLLLANSQRLQRSVGLVCTEESGVALLKEVSGEDQEAWFLANLALAAHDFQLSQHEFRPDRTTTMKRAYDGVRRVLAKQPAWCLFLFLESQLLVRLGNPSGALLKLQHAKLRAHRNVAEVAFAHRDWAVARTTLEPMAQRGVPDPTVYVMLASVLAMQLNLIASVEMLEKAERALPAKWKKRLRVLQHRPHKTTLFYEACYHHGFMGWMDEEVSGTLRIGGRDFSRAWLALADAELSEMRAVSEVFVVYPGAEMSRECALEEMLSIAFLQGCVSRMRGKRDEATMHLQHVIANATRGEDPWHVPYALYELALLEPDEKLKLAHLRKALKCRGYLYRSALSEKIYAMLQFLADSDAAVSMKSAVACDQLGVFIQGFGGRQSIAPNATGPTTTATVEPGGKHVYSYAVAKDQEISWQWGVLASDIFLQIEFQAPGEPVVVLEPSVRAETGDVNDGFFKSAGEGYVVFEWNNAHAPYTEKQVYYSVLSS